MSIAANIAARTRAALFAAGSLLLMFPGPSVRAEDAPPLPVLTNVIQIWQIPFEQRTQAFPIRTEMLIYVFDHEWNNSWGECQGVANFLPLSDCAVPLKPGQRVLVEGFILPSREQFDWTRTTVRVLEQVPLQPLVVPEFDDPIKLRSRLITVNALVDTTLEDTTHLTMRVLVGGRSAMAYGLKGTNAITVQPGDQIRITCVANPQFDRDDILKSLSLYFPSSDAIEVVGNLNTDPRFSGPLNRSNEIREDSPTNQIYLVEGVVRNHEPGNWLTIWDDYGQLMIRSDQTLPLRVGQRVRAFGRAHVIGVEQCLRDGLYRPLEESTPSPLRDSAPEQLILAEQVRELSASQAALRPKVNMRAVVTWSHANTPFAFVRDASGGVRILNPQWVGNESWKPGTIVTIEGEVVPGGFVPAVTNAVLTRSGWGDLRSAALVSMEQALTGVEDGNWIEMRGYVRDVTETNGLMRLDLSTSVGEFQVWTPTADWVRTMSGSVIRVTGVCAATANGRHQLTGIQLWSPESKFFKVEEPRPTDLFALPLRSISSLRQFSIERALNRRARTSGTVVLQAPGRYLCLQDGADGLFVLSQETNRFAIGDQVEVVGFPGNEGRKFLLREAVFRQVGREPEPRPVMIAAPRVVNLGLEGLLANADGTLLNIVRKSSDVVLLIESGGSAYEARFDASTPEQSAAMDLELGSRVALTGLYEVQRDEHGKPRSFMLHLRSPKDVVVLQRPPWWTFTRLLSVLLGVLVVFGVAVVWALLISRKNKLLHQAQSELQRANDELEVRVEQRTRQLRDQVQAKERARAELALTQRRLIAASRQAGMAEVATGVLHNVGNVLNSVNVSTTLLAERLRKSRVDYVAKCGTLLKRPATELTRFLTEDPRGKTLPEYLTQLGHNLDHEKVFMQGELDSLAKNIDHIKVIVAMQQSHAKSGGVLEELDVKDLIEDAIHINSAALDRHGIQLVREFQHVPPLLMDRHKVLQILINLISNAKWALNGQPGNRRIVVGLDATDHKQVRIAVRDNGVGISADDLRRIFTQGFTTRKDGHGFGLHSGANAAKELGGSLSVHSDGRGQGATFTLQLPLATAVPLPAAN